MPEQRLYVTNGGEDRGGNHPKHYEFLMDWWNSEGRESGTCRLVTEKVRSLDVVRGVPSGEAVPAIGIRSDRRVHLTRYQNTKYDDLLFIEDDEAMRNLGSSPDQEARGKNAYNVPLTRTLKADFETLIVASNVASKRNISRYNGEFEETERRLGFSRKQRPKAPDVEPFTPEYEKAMEKHFQESSAYFAQITPHLNEVAPILVPITSREMVACVELFLNMPLASATSR